MKRKVTVNKMAERFDFDEFDALCAEALEDAERTQSDVQLCLNGLARVFNSEQLALFDFDTNDVIQVRA